MRLPAGGDIPWRYRRPGGGGTTALPMAARLWLSDPEALIDLALEHAGIAQVGLYHATPLLRSGRLKAALTDLHDPGGREIVLHYPHRQYLAPRVRVTVDALLSGLAKNADLHAARDALSDSHKA